MAVFTPQVPMVTEVFLPSASGLQHGNVVYSKTNTIKSNEPNFAPNATAINTKVCVYLQYSNIFIKLYTNVYKIP